MLKNKLLSSSGAAADLLAIEDVFSTYLYTGNGSTQTITNGIDLAGEGGLVWTKSRSNANGALIYDTVRGINSYLIPSSTQETQTSSGTLTTFSSDGFTLGANDNSNDASGESSVSWTFRKAPRFFDVVTYTGNGTNFRQIPHNLGVPPGIVIIKATSDGTRNWGVWSKHLADVRGGSDLALYLNTNNPQGDYWFCSGVSDATFGVMAFDYGSPRTVGNANGVEYVAYLFAHDPLGPSGDGSDGLIACGGYTGNGSDTAGPVVDLGWEPQLVIVKRATGGTGDWLILDTMRGMSHTSVNLLRPNTSDAELALADGWFRPLPTGFQVMAPGQGDANASGSDYIYIAIRRGPMRPPESGSEVFAVDTKAVNTAVYNTGFPVDMLWNARRDGSVDNFPFVDRLRGTTSTAARWLVSSSNVAEKTGSGFGWATDSNTTWTSNGVWSENPQVGYAFRRAPEFFDVVAYTGDGTTEQTFSHSLGVVPEMVIIKNRSRASTYWPVRFSDAITTNMGKLNSSDAFGFNVIGTLTDTTVQTLYTNQFVTNYLGDNYIAYLFASKAGVSKVGSYTGNGTSQTINCGFTTGARFILIKRTDSTGDWYVWDTARGIVAANDPHLSLNTTAAEVTTNDSIDPASSGFIVNQIAATNINVSSASYIFMAIS